MRKAAAAPVTARKTSLPVDGRESPAKLVCLALALALLVLASRIASIW
jgi:hypothetical protein